MNIGDKALQVLRTVAPLLGTALGGPLGGLAGQALSAALGTAAGDDKATTAALLSATPDQLVALQKANNDFQVQMKTLGVQEEQLAFQDVASARAREIAVKDWIPGLLAILLTCGFFGILSYMITVGIKTTDTGGEALLVMLGSLGTAWTAVITYYFGSSAGAQKNAETIAIMAKNGGGSHQ